MRAASEGGASVLYTEDLNAGQVMEGVRIVNPLLDSAVHDAASTAAPIERGEQDDFEARTRLMS
ncbi:MAG: hypothetical protein WD397_07715 [Wenzhouxiangellaceae bacterium]